MNYEHKSKKRSVKTHPGTTLRHLPGMQCSRSTGQIHSSQTRSQALGSGRHTQKSQVRSSGSTDQSRQAGTSQTNRGHRAVPESLQRTGQHQRRSICRGARAGLVKKKNELGLQGPLLGHFKKEVKLAVVNAIKESLAQGLTQKKACEIFGLAPRKFRRWTNPEPIRPRTAWNKLLDHEHQAILDAAWSENLLGKPLSHLFVHGHEKGSFFASISSIYRVLKPHDMVQNFQPKRRKNTAYVSAHKLLNDGFSLLCYDGTVFTTNYGVDVWAIPVILLPHRVCLHIGHSLRSVCSDDLTRTVQDAYAMIPEHMIENVLAHSDRGSAMKAGNTKKIIHDLLGAPVHFGRPRTPDDQAWIEAFIKTLKYHRDVPASFAQVDDVVQWLNRFTDIYNNDPHSSLGYVTPLQALAGQKEVILNQRKQNLALARRQRYTAWQLSQRTTKVTLHAA